MLQARAGLGRAAGRRAAADAVTLLRALPAEGSASSASRDIGDVRLGAGGRVRDGRAADDAAAPLRRRHADGWRGWPRSPSPCWRSSRSPFPRCGICARHRHLAARDARRDRHARHRQPTSFALSPDGRQIVFVASGDGASRLWLRSLATTTAQPLAGTEGATFPFWSPDSRSIGFFAGGALKRLDLGGGAPQTLAPVTRRSRRDVERGRRHRVCAEHDDRPDARVRHRGRGGGGDDARPAAGEPRRAVLSARRPPVPVLRARRAGHGRDLPGRARRERPDPADARRQRRVFCPSVLCHFAGWLLWVRAGTLVAQRLDVAQAALTGEPVTLADGVAVDANFRSAVSVAATGLVAYRTGAGSQRQLTWVDRSGTARGTVGDPDGTISPIPACPPTAVAWS